MKACGCLGYTELALQLHGFVTKLDLGSEMCIKNSIIDMYIKCEIVAFVESVFLNTKSSSLFCWNSIIYGW